jgi:dihydrofolate reductase
VTSVDLPRSLEFTDGFAIQDGTPTCRPQRCGSPTTVRWLLREGLLDELNLLVHPIVVGDGLARPFPPDEPRIPFELRSAQTFKTGVLNLSFALAKD